METYPKWAQSSVNKDKLSMTIKGFILMVIPALVFVLQLKGFSITENQLVQVVDLVSGWIASTMIVVGLIRKVLVYFKIL